MLNNQRGVSAIELLGGIAVAAAVSLGGAALLKNIEAGKKEAGAKSNTMMIEKMFEQHMYSRKGCDVLVGKKIGDPFEVKVADMMIKGGGTVDPTDMRFKQTKIESLQIEGFTPSDATNTRGVTMLTLKMESNERKLTKEIPMPVNVAAVAGGLVIESCLLSEKGVEAAIMGRVCPDTYGVPTAGNDCTQTAGTVRNYLIEKICTELDQGTLTSMGIDTCIMNHLHANQTCLAGNLATGFDWQGNLVCDGAPVPPPPPAGCASWTAWAPDVTTQCKDVNFEQSRSCNDGIVTDTQKQGAIGSKTDGTCAAPLICNISYTGYNDNQNGTTAQDGAWNVWGKNDDNDKECNNRGCAISLGLSCKGPTRVRLKYQFKMNVTSAEITSVWSDAGGALTWGGPAVVKTDKVDECDGGPGCGMRLLAETEDSSYKCTTSYQYRNEKVASVQKSDGVWSQFVNDADDDNCENNTGCGIRATISCVKL